MPGPDRWLYIPDDRRDLLRFTLRVILWQHSAKPKAKYAVVPSAPMASAAKSHHSLSSISSIAEILGVGSAQSKEKKSPKFPKELIKLLEVAIKRVVMRQDPAYDDVLLRGSFGAFYAYFTTEAFQKSMKDNRKIEDVILMFFSKVTAELQKRLPDVQVMHTTNVHVAKFVHLLLYTVRSNRLASNESDLVSRLAAYEAKILQNSEILVEKDDRQKEEVIERPPEVGKSASLTRICDIFDVSVNVLQDLVEQTWCDCTAKALIQDLKKSLHALHCSRGNYQTNDFESEDIYLGWKQGQIAEITQHMVDLAKKDPSLARTTEVDRLNPRPSSMSRSNSVMSNLSDLRLSTTDSATFAKETESLFPAQGYFYSPPTPVESYEELFELAIQVAIRTQQHVSRPVVEELHLMDQSTSSILAECRKRWRIPESTHKSLFLQACAQLYLEDKIDLEWLDGALLNEKSLSCEPEDTWPTGNIDRYKLGLLQLNEFLFRDSFTALQAAFAGSLDARALTILTEHVHSNIFFDTISKQVSYLFDEVEDGMRSEAADTFEVMVKDIRGPAPIEILHVIQLAETIIKQFRKLQKKYKKPILRVISIWNVFGSVVFDLFLRKVSSLLGECHTNAPNADVDLPMEEMFNLYQLMCEMLECIKICQGDYRPPIKIDLLFRAVVLRWLQESSQSILELVPKAIAADDFTCVEIANDDAETRSQSIVMLFRSFNQHINYLKDLHWPDEYWNAKFKTALCKTISEAIKEYCITVERLFFQEMNALYTRNSQYETLQASLQQRLMAKAKDVIIRKEIIEPFHISSSACIKVNNIEWAKLHLDSLEKSMNSAQLSRVLEQYEGPKPAWQEGQSTIFTIKVVSAQDLVACDDNGFSDPYVVLSDQKGKRIGKTRTIFTDLNPRWNESFDVPTTEPLWLAATVWDRDAGGEHDICGRCYFKLDPRYFDDFLPKDFHIPLDTQGSLQLQITMEGETDDSSFYFGRAFRFLNRAEGDMTRAIVDKLTPLVTSSLSRQTLKSLLNKPITIDTTIDTAFSLLNKAGFTSNRTSQQKLIQFTNQELEAPVEPLMQYFDKNFTVLDSSLGRSAFSLVMKKLWKFVVIKLEDMAVPPLPTRATNLKRPLRELELDIVYKWLGFMKDTFAGDGGGLTEAELQIPEYHELLSLRFFYYDDDQQLMDECDRTANNNRQQKKQIQPGNGLARSGTRAAYNLGTIKQRKEEILARRRELATNEEIVLRVLRLRGSEAVKRFLSHRIEQRNQEAMQAVLRAGMTRQVGGTTNRTRTLR